MLGKWLYNVLEEMEKIKEGKGKTEGESPWGDRRKWNQED